MHRVRRLASIAAGITAGVILSMAVTLLFGNHFALAQGAAHVDVVTVKGVIDSLIAQYLARGIQLAEQDGAQCPVIQMDTPGGSDDAMRDIVQHMLSPSVPIVVYVLPSGAKAGSAGVFITLASNIAAMAPGTNIGAARPVEITGEITGMMNDMGSLWSSFLGPFSSDVSTLRRCEKLGQV